MPKTMEPAAALVEAPSEFPYGDGDYLFHLMVAVSRYRDDDLERSLRPVDLNLSHYRAMGVLAHLAPCSMTELAEISLVDRTTLTRTVDHLVRRGLADRCHAKADRRQIVLCLTEDGWSRYLMAREVVQSRNDVLLAKLPAPLQRALIKSQQALIASWDLGEELTHRLLTLSRGHGQKTAKSGPAAAND
jgi:DNA-binding MarR family transcriptional regulator